MSSIKIGEYQLRNLIENRVKFLYLDLRSQPSSDHELLAGGIKTAPEAVLATVRQAGVASDGPIVLICETGEKSMAAALELARREFINVFVVEGGIEGLPGLRIGSNTAAFLK